MKSTINLTLTIEHLNNLAVPDAQGIADLTAELLSPVIRGDVRATVKSAAITGLVPMTVQAVHNA
jgi:hypothetical protein